MFCNDAEIEKESCSFFKFFYLANRHKEELVLRDIREKLL